MPGLLEDFDNVQACTDIGTKVGLRQALIEKCWEYDRQLLSWFDLVCQKADFCDHPLPDPGPDGISPFPLSVVHGMCLFWTTCLMLYSTLRTIHDQPASLSKRTEPK